MKNRVRKTHMWIVNVLEILLRKHQLLSICIITQCLLFLILENSQDMIRQDTSHARRATLIKG